MKTSRRSLLLVFVLGALWGLPYALTKLSLMSIPPMPLAAARILFAACVLWVFVLVRKQRLPRQPVFVVQLFIQGFLGCVLPYMLISFGQQTISSALAAILNSSTPIFLCILGPFFAPDERTSRKRLVGVLVGFAGVLLVVGATGFGRAGSGLIGQGAIVLATISSAVSLIYGRRFKDTPPELVATGTLTAAALLTAPLLFFNAGSIIQATPSALAALVCNSVVATALGFVIYFRLIEEAGPVSTSSVGYLKPAFGVLIGVGLLGETLSWTTLAGFVTVLLGVVLIVDYDLVSVLRTVTRAFANGRVSHLVREPLLNNHISRHQ